MSHKCNRANEKEIRDRESTHVSVNVMDWAEGFQKTNDSTIVLISTLRDEKVPASLLSNTVIIYF